MAICQGADDILYVSIYCAFGYVTGTIPADRLWIVSFLLVSFVLWLFYAQASFIPKKSDQWRFTYGELIQIPDRYFTTNCLLHISVTHFSHTLWLHNSKEFSCLSIRQAMIGLRC